MLVRVVPGVSVVALLERERELARVERVFDRLGAGVGAAAVVEGPAGIGKSELLAAVGAGAQARGFGVLTARGSEFEQDIAFGIARQLFESMLRAASPGERRRLLDGVARVGARALGFVAGDLPADRFAAIHGLYWLAANRAERCPVVIVVDDVQWADDRSLAWLGYLARRLRDLPVALVLGSRSGDPGGERAELAGLIGDGGVERIVLGALSEAAVRGIVRTQLDDAVDEAFCAACSELTGGNPLLLRELLVGAREDGLAARTESVAALRRIAPAAVGTSVLARLGRLGSEPVALARAVAVLDAGAEVTLAAELAGLDPVVAELSADRLAAAQILAPVRPLEFFHPLIGAAIRQDIAPGARRVAHRRAAELLYARSDECVTRVAMHLLPSPPAGDGWAVEVLRAAAREEAANGEPESGARCLERALAEAQPPAIRAELLLELGETQLQAGFPGAPARIRESLELSADPRRRTEICLALGRALFNTGEWAAAREALRRGLAELEDGDDDDLSLELRGWYMMLGRKGSAEVREGRLKELLEDHSPGRTRIDSLLLGQLAFDALRSGAQPHDGVVRLARRALADGALLEDSATLTGPYSAAACYALLYAGEPDAVVVELDRAGALSRRRGSAVAFAQLSRLRGTVQYFRGALLEALADLESAIGTYSEGMSVGCPGRLGLSRCACSNATIWLAPRAHWRCQPIPRRSASCTRGGGSERLRGNYVRGWRPCLSATARCECGTCQIQRRTRRGARRPQCSPRASASKPRLRSW
jgi:tetratricopeptide (TPR) repeat protein